MKDYAARFYKSKAWQECAAAYKKSKGGLCEECLKHGIIRPAVIVHHKIHISTMNIYNPEITLNWNNLEALCRECHAKRHSRQKRFVVDRETGSVAPLAGSGG